MAFRVPERYRVVGGAGFYNTHQLVDGNNGLFLVPSTFIKGHRLRIIASDADGAAERGMPRWEHVSISVHNVERMPHWDEMCQVKAMFWEEEDCVVQFHPPRSEYVNQHPRVLHLWRPLDYQLVTPPTIYVGVHRPRQPQEQAT
jgi:hypothetical protein